MRLPVEPLLTQRMKAPDMRSVNGIQLLNLVVEYGPVSRATLAKLSRLSKPTVSEQIQRLIALGTVIELGEGESSATGGKRPTLVAFHADAGRVAGISIAPGVSRISLCNLAGEPRASAEVPTEPFENPRRLVDRVRRALDKLLRNDAAGVSLRAIGIGVPGRVDCSRGVVLELENVFRWQNLDLATPFQRRFSCPVLVDNDVNVALMAELQRGAARDVRTAVLIRADVGTGAAIAIDRRIHHGCHWAAGEIGHLVPTRATLEIEDRRGHMEAVVAKDRIEARVSAAARKIPVLRKYLRNSSPLAALFAASKEDAAAAAIAGEVSEYFCLAVAQHALLFDPDIVLLSGEIFPHILEDIRSFVAKTIPWSPSVEMAALEDEAVTTGAIDLALKASYEQISQELQADAMPVSFATGGGR